MGGGGGGFPGTYGSINNAQGSSSSGNGNWGNSSTLMDHFNRHGSDFNSISPQDYSNKATNFYNDRANYQIKTDQSGVIKVYDASTNTFGSYNADGSTRTFFKPSGGQSYFDRQPGS